MHGPLAILLFASMIASPSGVLSIQVDEARDRFRIVVESDRNIDLDVSQIESPGPGFPAAYAAVLAMNSRGEIVGCYEDNRPRHPADSISGSRWPRDSRVVQVAAGRRYESQWFKSQSLFFAFDGCVLPERRGEYVKYQILIEIETSRGVISGETGWIDFHGFKTSQSGGFRRDSEGAEEGAGSCFLPCMSRRIASEWPASIGSVFIGVGGNPSILDESSRRVLLGRSS